MRARKWTKEEDEQLKGLYEKMPLREIAKTMERSYDSISCRARLLELKKGGQPTVWTEERIAFLKEHGNNVSAKEIAKQLGLKIPTVYKKLRELGLECWVATGERWTEEEVQYLKDTYLIKPYNQIARKLEKTTSSVQQKAAGLGLSKPKNRSYTREEENYLKENYSKLSKEQIAINLKRTTSSVFWKARELGLSDLDVGGRKIKKEQELFIIANADKMTDKKIASILKCSDKTVAMVRKNNEIFKTGIEVRGQTNIEEIVEKELLQYPISFVFDQPYAGFRPDFINHEHKLLIEVQGDYWHCNPKIYETGPKDDIQLKHIIRDYYKKCYFLSNDYRILYLWENDILNHFQAVQDEIKEFLSAVQR